jgi:hypothetical protein
LRVTVARSCFLTVTEDFALTGFRRFFEAFMPFSESHKRYMRVYFGARHSGRAD